MRRQTVCTETAGLLVTLQSLFLFARIVRFHSFAQGSVADCSSSIVVVLR